MKLRLFIIFTFGIYTISFGQEFTELKTALQKRIPNDSIINADGSWYYYPDKGEIEKISKPKVSEQIPNYEFYKVHLINYLGYHKNNSDCLILLNKENSKSILIEPLWYSGINTDFLKMFVGIKFNSKEALLSFLSELQDLMLIGSKHSKTFENTEYKDDKVTFDLIENMRKRKIWRKIEIKIKDLTIVKFKSTNPVTKKTTKIN